MIGDLPSTTSVFLLPDTPIKVSEDGRLLSFGSDLHAFTSDLDDEQRITLADRLHEAAQAIHDAAVARVRARLDADVAQIVTDAPPAEQFDPPPAQETRIVTPRAHKCEGSELPAAKA